MKLEVIFLNASLHIHLLTFILQLGSPFVSSILSPYFLAGTDDMLCYQDRPINFINGKYHKKQLKIRKSHKTPLNSHTACKSQHSMALVINTLEGGHADTYIAMHEQKQFPDSCVKVAGWCAPGLKMLHMYNRNSQLIKDVR